MKSIANQYRDLKEGRLSQVNFMRNLRMSMPQYITNVTSFNDAVRILKNKAILSEATVNSPEDVKEQWFEEFQNAIENMDISPEKKAKAMKALDHVDVIDTYGMFQPRFGANAFIGDIDLDEAYADEAPSYDYNGKKLYVDNQSGEPDEVGGKVSLYDENKNEYVGIISSIDREGMISVDPESIQPVEDTELASILAKYGDEDLGPEKYKFQDFPGGISEAKKKKEAKAELNPNQIHPQELRMGIKVELEHTDDLDKAKKIALDHLAENPFYYTALKLAGVESPSAPKYKAPEEKKTKKKKEEVELVDKVNAMQKVKMPKVVKESQLNEAGGEYTFNGTLTADEIKELDGLLGKGKYDFDVEEVDDHYETTIRHNFYNELNLKDAIDQITGRKASKPSFRPGVDLGKSFDKFKSTLEEIVREVINETFDGRDNVTDVAGHQLDEK